MKIAVPKEILNNENRVSVTPGWARALVESGHEVYVQAGAGIASSFHDDDYQAAGAKILDTAEDIFKAGDIIVKVKQPLEAEFKLIQERHIVFTYFHLAADPNLVDAMRSTGAHCVAYETIEDSGGRLPLLRPMSEIAGRMSVQVGARFLERGVDQKNPGRGILLGGSSGVPQATVTIIGGGVVGQAALKIAMGMGAYVNIIDNNINTLGHIDDLYGSRVTSIFSTSDNIEKAVKHTDLLVGAVLIPGRKAPKLVTEEMVRNMKYGSVIVDVAVDQGGCIETSEPTSHSEPVVNKHDVLHYGVINMPGAVPHTSTQALCNATMPYLMKLASQGLDAMNKDPGFKKGLNVSRGELLIEL